MNEFVSGEPTTTFLGINPLIREYETLITTFKEELEFYKVEQNHLKNESAILLEENRALSNYIKTNLQTTQDCDLKCYANDSEVVKNLESQIAYLLKEKEATTQLWRNSLETVDHLENELRLHEGRTHGYVSTDDVAKIKQDHQKQIKQLEMDSLQSKIQLMENQKSTKSIIDSKDYELKQFSVNHQETTKTIEHLKKTIEELQLENKKLQQEITKLTETIKEKETLISNLRKKEKESQVKVSEAINIVEQALIEKDAALSRERDAKAELSRNTKALTEDIEESSKKLRAELDQAKQQYIQKIQKLKCDMKNLTSFIKRKDSELENQKKTTKVLQEKLDIISKSNFSTEEGNTSKLLILEKNLETTFQKLLYAEKKNIQLEAEKTSIKEDLEQMASMYERDIQMRESEKLALQRKISSLQEEVDVSTNGLLRVASRVDEVNGKLRFIESELLKQLHMKDLKHKEILSNKMKEIEMTNSKLNDNIKKRLQSQIQFNRKWKATVNDIIEKLESKVHGLKKESNHLKQINKELTLSLKKSEEQLTAYKERLKSLCLDVTKVANYSREHYNVNPQIS